MKMELFQKNFNARQWRTLQAICACSMLSDLQLVYMVPRNTTQLLNINTTKFQVERDPVYWKPVSQMIKRDLSDSLKIYIIFTS